MKRLLVYCPSMTDGTSFYRGIGPLSTLMKERDDLSIQLTDKFNWATLSMCDAVFMQRPFTDTHMSIANMCVENGKPLWVDYDDDLFSIPQDNPSWHTYSEEKIRANMAQMITLSSVVTVSTEDLKDKFRDLNKNIHIIHNAFDDSRFERAKRCEPDKLIVWRGSETHIKDLLTFAPQIVQLSNENPDWTWAFFGYQPWMLMNSMPKGRCLHIKPVDPIKYFKVLRNIKPSIMIVPLWSCPFNEAKSNIAWLEASSVGASVVAPDTREWKKPGIVTYDSPSGFYDGVRALIHAPEEFRSQMVDQSWKHIGDNLLLSHVNKLRSNIIDGLFKKNTTPDPKEV